MPSSCSNGRRCTSPSKILRIAAATVRRTRTRRDEPRQLHSSRTQPPLPQCRTIRSAAARRRRSASAKGTVAAHSVRGGGARGAAAVATQDATEHCTAVASQRCAGARGMGLYWEIPVRLKRDRKPRGLGLTVRKLPRNLPQGRSGAPPSVSSAFQPCSGAASARLLAPDGIARRRCRRLATGVSGDGTKMPMTVVVSLGRVYRTVRDRSRCEFVQHCAPRCGWRLPCPASDASRCSSCSSVLCRPAARLLY